MPSAFVLINAEIEFESSIFKELEKIPNIKEAHVLYGIYDVIAKVEAESMDKLKEIISRNIRCLAKVRSTLTMIIIEGK